jgi:hypothetical protein
MRLHRKVWLWYGRWWAVQLYLNSYVSLGLHVDFRKPYLDIHALWFIVSVGNNPVFGWPEDQQRGSCRGMLAL